MRPESAFRTPEISPISVVLPAPFGPMSAWISPAWTSRPTASVATTPPKRLLSLSRRSTSFPRHEPREALRREEHDGEQHDADAEVRVLLVVRHELRKPRDRIV